MDLVDRWFVWFLRNDLLREMADEIAERCRDAVRQHVWSRGVTMPAAEARGYVRVRAKKLAQQAMDQVLAQQDSLSRGQREVLFQMTMQRLIAVTTKDLARERRRRRRQRAAWAA